ncbi:MAG: hypothetical protein AAGH81_03130 [Bacteroidota bacterium]
MKTSSPFVKGILLTIALMLASCKNPKKTDYEFFGLEEQIISHFGGMGFSQIRLKSPYAYKTKPRYYEGSGTFKNLKGKQVDYKWVHLANQEGDLLGMYFGTEGLENGSVAYLSREESRSRGYACFKDKTDNEIDSCLEELYNQMGKDCDFSATIEECREHCWWATSFYCGGEDA